jgi:aspartyl-tRNA synthetase
MYRTHTCGELRREDANKSVTLAGWADAVRVQGRIGFVLLRDRYGITQCFIPKEVCDEVKLTEIRKESVLQIHGVVALRPEKQVRAEVATGEIEVKATSLRVLSAADPLPLELDESVQNTEETRLKYRYLDLRRPKMARNIALRHKTIKFFRDYLDRHGFLEISTPILTKSTPEGARDYLVPSRLHRGCFYALPQSPQQYKQLLMVAGMDKYFQIAPCFRDEAARAHRAPGEFYQLDLEMSFVQQGDILALTEEMFVKMIAAVFPEKRITQVPFPRIPYDKAMEQYGTDSPDLRQDKSDKDELAFCWVIDFPLFTRQTQEDYFYGAGKVWAPSHHMFTMPKEEDLPLLDTEPGKARAYQHDLVLNGFEVGGGSIRIHDAKVQEKIFDLIGFTPEQKKEFAHMLEAFRYGVPPHGGIAPGIDRLLMVILGEESIRDVIAFPKDKAARDPVMNAPSPVPQEQLDELGLSIKKQDR